MHRLVVLFAAMCLTTPALAQNYNALVVQVPYEVSVAAEYERAEIVCEIIHDYTAPDTFRTIVRKPVPLTNGQASGVAKFGYDLVGSTPDLVSVADVYIQRFQEVVARPNFQLYYRCAIAGVYTGNTGYPLSDTSSGALAILDGNGAALQYLDDSSVIFNEGPMTAADNEAGRVTAPTSNTTVTQPSTGLNSLLNTLSGNN